MAELTGSQVQRLLDSIAEFQQQVATATQARTVRDELILGITREAKLTLPQVTALTGLHHSQIRASIRRAAGPGTTNWDQPELDFEATTYLPPLRNSARLEQGQHIQQR